MLGLNCMIKKERKTKVKIKQDKMKQNKTEQKASGQIYAIRYICLWSLL